MHTGSGACTMGNRRMMSGAVTLLGGWGTLAPDSLPKGPHAQTSLVDGPDNDIPQ